MLASLQDGARPFEVQGRSSLHSGRLADAAGCLRVALAKEPRTIRFDHAGWRLAPGSSIASDTGNFRTWEPFVRAVLEREK